jgi:hypothetical protein
MTKREKKNKRKGQTRKGYEQVGLQDAPHLQDLKQNHSENAKSGNSKQEFFSNKQPSRSL